MSQINKGLLTGAVVVTFAFVVLGIEALRSSRPGLFLRVMLWTAFGALMVISLHFAQAADYRAGEPAIFGSYSKAYQDRAQLKRWRELCRGGGRYLAMAEAYDARKPDPCQPGAKEWRR